MNGRRVREDLFALGFYSSTSERSTSGLYAPSDAEWNYKDIPHLAEVHNQVDGVLIDAGDQHVASVLLQKIGPLSVPLLIYIGDTGKSGAIYVGVVGPFVLMVSTTWLREASVSTRVVTKYELFSKKPFRFLHPFIHRLLSRNYDTLMKADLPMREQRGRLRSRGYSFRGDVDGYRFRQSTNVHLRNLIAPESLRSVSISIELPDIPEGRSKHGGDAEDGIVVERRGQRLILYPLICDHEGASLTCAAMGEGGLRCPWHGRTVRPLAVVDLKSKTAESSDRGSMVALTTERLIIHRNF